MELSKQPLIKPEIVEETVELTPIERAAVLMVALESETPGITNNIFSHMGEDKSKLMLRTIASLGRVGAEVVNRVIDEFFSIAIENKYIFGGEEVSSKILRDTFGVTPQDDFFSEKVNLFEFVDKLGDEDLVKYIETENLQCLALILNYLDSERLSEVLSLMEIDKAKEVSQLLIEIDVPNLHLVWEFQNALQDNLGKNKTVDASNEDVQIFKMARALEMVSPTVREEIFRLLDGQNNRALGKLKELIFTFKDLEFVTDKDMETILYEVTNLRSLAISIRECSEVLLEKVHNNISDRVKIMLDEETAALPDEIEQDDIEKAQRDILKVARKLERERKIDRLMVRQVKVKNGHESPKIEGFSQEIMDKLNLDEDGEL